MSRQSSDASAGGLRSHGLKQLLSEGEEDEGNDTVVVKNTFLEVVHKRGAGSSHRSMSDPPSTRSMSERSFNSDSGCADELSSAAASLWTQPEDELCETGSPSGLGGSAEDSEPDGFVPSWSVGSAQHAAGKCRPCLYATAAVGCFNGEKCKFCHLEHPKPVRSRPCRAKRAQCKMAMAMLDELVDNPQKFNELFEKLGQESSYMRSILKSKYGYPPMVASAATPPGSASSSSSNIVGFPQPEASVQAAPQLALTFAHEGMPSSVQLEIPGVATVPNSAVGYCMPGMVLPQTGIGRDESSQQAVTVLGTFPPSAAAPNIGGLGWYQVPPQGRPKTTLFL